MTTDRDAKQATPHDLLIEQLLDSRIPKTEREHAAAREIAALRARPPSSALALVRQQAEDEGLWFQAQDAPEAYLQQELRRLHAAVEGEPQPEPLYIECSNPPGPGPAVFYDVVTADGKSVSVGKWTKHDNGTARLGPLFAGPVERVDEPVAWRPIETAPKDNKRPLYLARFVDGELVEIDFDGAWKFLQESWEMPHVQGWDWVSARGIEEPTHWAYQDEPPPPQPERG